MKLLNGERAITTQTVGVSGAATLASGSVTVAYASGVTGDTDVMNALGSVSVSTGAGTLLDASGAGLTTNITLTYQGATGGFTVSLKATGGLSFSATDTLLANASGDYVYNDHGVSFTIKGTDIKQSSGGTVGSTTGTISALETITIKTTTATTTGSIATVNNWDFNTGNVSISTGITVTATTDNANVRAISIQTSASSGTTVTLYDQFSAGRTAIQTDFINTTQATMTYNAHGISFTMSNTLSALNTASALISLTSLGTTKTLVETTTEVSNNSLKFQVGANENQSLSLDITDMRATALGISSTSAGGAFQSSKTATNGTSSTASEYTLDVSTNAKAAAAVTVLNSAISSVSDERAKLGSVQNRLEHTINNLDTAAENLQASESRIRDVDMAKEMMEFTKNNILMQAAQSMLAQANQQPQGVLQLLR
jgi:flagellin